jgi:hypothetical protein
MTEIFEAFVDAANAQGRPFILIGGHAINAHGYERTTLDFDFLVLGSDQADWKKIMASIGYTPIHETAAFIQFAPETGGSMRVDLMLVGDSTFEKLHLASETKSYGGRTIQIASVLHLIALKLHATRTWNRAVQGKDYYDILNLIQIHRIDSSSEEFQQILSRYATDSIRERLISDLKRLA